MQHGSLYWSESGRHGSSLSLKWAGLLQEWDARLVSPREPTCWDLAGLYVSGVRCAFEVEMHTAMTVHWSSLIAAAVAVACEKSIAPATLLPPSTRIGHYVTPGGSASGNGSPTQPWDLATVFTQPVAVQAGDTIWLRAGTYRGAFTSQLTGTTSAPIIVRQYPGERATIDGNLVVRGAYTWYWGFEVTSSVLAPQNLMAVDVTAPNGPGVKLINLIIHDAGGNGAGVQSPRFDAEVYGCIIYNNGRQRVVPGYAHGIYIQNDMGTKVVSDNFLFHNLGVDLHAYGTTAALRNLQFLYNVGINTSQIGTAVGWLLQTQLDSAMENIVFRGNMIYGSRAGSVVSLGPNAPAGRDLTFVDNYVWGGTTEFKRWTTLQVTGNTFMTLALRLYANSPTFPTGPVYVLDNNYYVASTSRQFVPEFDTWLNEVAQPLANLSGWQVTAGYDQHSTITTSASGKPSMNQVFVRPNQYETGRGNIVIYNWQQLAAVPVDVSSILRGNDQYEVRNVQDFFGAPVLKGIYQGGTLAIPMTAVTPPVPLGGWPGPTPPPTGPEFNAFVVLRTAP